MVARKEVMTLTDMLVSSKDKDASAARGAVAQQTLREAYIAFGRGRPSRDQLDLVLVDLAKSSGYYNTTPADAPDTVLRHNEGQRELFGRIMRFMNPTISEMAALQKAVVQEMQTDAALRQEIT